MATNLLSILERLAPIVEMVLPVGAAAYAAVRLGARQAIRPDLDALHDRIDQHMDAEEADRDEMGEAMQSLSVGIAYIAGALGIDLADAQISGRRTGGRK